MGCQCSKADKSYRRFQSHTDACALSDSVTVMGNRLGAARQTTRYNRRYSGYFGGFKIQLSFLVRSADGVRIVDNLLFFSHLFFHDVRKWHLWLATVLESVAGDCSSGFSMPERRLGNGPRYSTNRNQFESLNFCFANRCVCNHKLPHGAGSQRQESKTTYCCFSVCNRIASSALSVGSHSASRDKRSIDS